MFLTQHFQDYELGVLGCDARILQNAVFLCANLLEPIRNRFNTSLNVHDSYRDFSHNQRVGGKPDSFHLFNDAKSAADFDVHGYSLSEVFNWICLESELMFDKVILESNLGVPRALHLQVDSDAAPRRQAFIGGTGDSHQYQQVEVK